MAGAAASGAVLNGLGSSFLRGTGDKRRLLGSSATATRVTTGARKSIVVAALPPKKSWIPGVKAGGNFTDPEWLDGS